MTLLKFVTEIELKNLINNTFKMLILEIYYSVIKKLNEQKNSIYIL